MSLDIRVTFNRLPDYSRDVGRKINDATAKVALDIESDWKQNIRDAGLIDTGNYLNSVQARQEGPADWVVETGARSDRGFPYPVALEYGTSRGIPAHGVATAAAEANRQAYERAIAQALGEL